ncbi:MAG TPA: tetratricopeptide repeat protein [Pyrinomonadaceae bacterium]|nr:tetratricopeptide repeat protein [Pyrinomonadaceae bacterium]
MTNFVFSSTQPRERRRARLTSGRKPANVIVLLLIVGTFSVSHAQKENTHDVNLGRLSQAVEAISLGEFSKAEKLLKSVLGASPNDPDALNLLGVVRAEEHKASEAESLFRRALASSPTHVGVHINLAKLLQSTNRLPEALRMWKAAQRLAPDRAEINLNLATLSVDTGDYLQALEYLRLIPRVDVDDEYFLLTLKSLLGLKRLDASRQFASEFKEIKTVEPETQARFAMLLAKGGLSDEALDLLEVARGRSPAAFPVSYALGVINAARRQYDKAEQHLSDALKIKPDDVTTLRALANVSRATGNLEKALSYLVQARHLAPNDQSVLYDFGVTTLKMELLLDALPVFEQLHNAYPRKPNYLYALAAVRWRKGETVETARLMKSYVLLQPQDPLGFYLLGAALLRQDLFGEARAALERSLTLKADPDTEYLLGVSLEKEGNRAAAIEIYRKIVNSRPDHAAAHAALGAAYREVGNYVEARTALERAVQLDASDLRANYQLGLVYAKLGEKEAAKKMFARADELRQQHRSNESVILKLIEPPQQ